MALDRFFRTRETPNKLARHTGRWRGKYLEEGKPRGKGPHQTHTLVEHLVRYMAIERDHRYVVRLYGLSTDGNNLRHEDKSPATIPVRVRRTCVVDFLGRRIGQAKEEITG